MNSETIFYVGIAIALAATLWGRVIRERGLKALSDPKHGYFPHAQNDIARCLHEICVPSRCFASHRHFVDRRGFGDVFII